MYNVHMNRKKEYEKIGLTKNERKASSKATYSHISESFRKKFAANFYK